MAVELYDEIEQGERVKRWIREYAMAVVLGVALAFGGIFGWRQWQTYQVTQSHLVSERYGLFQELLEEGDFVQAQAMREELREGHSRHAYTALAGLEIAGAYVDRGELDRAAEIYDEVLAQRKLDALHPIARLRLSRLQLSLGDAEAAMATLGGVAPPGFESVYAEVRGDIELQRGNPEKARVAYQEALENLLPDAAGAAQLLELKLQSLQSARSNSS